MTDHPRFTRVRGSPDEIHRDHHGGRLVDFVLRLADGRRRPAARPLSAGPDAATAMQRLDEVELEALMARVPVRTRRGPGRLAAGIAAGAAVVVLALALSLWAKPLRVAHAAEGAGRVAGVTASVTASALPRAATGAGQAYWSALTDENGALRMP